MTVNRIPLANLAHQLTPLKLSGQLPERINSVRIDSRNCCPGDLFVALRGGRRDGHNFVADAVENGVAVALVEQQQPLDIPQIVVDQSLFALQQLARAYRRNLSDYFIGITGSCGKTTVKEMLAAILSQKYDVRKSPGNYNNHIGLPLTLLNYAGGDYLVAEIGMNSPGEIQQLTGILQPHMGIITHVGPAHLQQLEDVESVAREKAALLAGLADDGIALIPGWIPYQQIFHQATAARLLKPGRSAESQPRVDWEIRPGKTVVTLDDFQFELNFQRPELIKDSLIAATAARELGIEPQVIGRCLARFEPLAGRGREFNLGSTRVIDGSYNANPDSMQAALRRLEQLPPKRLAVLGTMNELGNSAISAHRELGESLARIADLEVHFVGRFGPELATGMGGNCGLHLHDTVEELDGLDPTSFNTVLIKGSNSIGLKKLVENWVERL